MSVYLIWSKSSLSLSSFRVAKCTQVTYQHINTTEVFKLPMSMVFFGNEDFRITDHQPYGHFTLCVLYRVLDWQIDCAVQICSVLMPALSSVQWQRLDYDGLMMPTRWIISEIDATTWHELLRSFIGVYELHICGAFSPELVVCCSQMKLG